MAPDSIESVDLDPDSRQAKMIPKVRKKSRKFKLKSSLEGWRLLLEPKRAFQSSNERQYCTPKREIVKVVVSA